MVYLHHWDYDPTYNRFTAKVIPTSLGDLAGELKVEQSHTMNKVRVSLYTKEDTLRASEFSIMQGAIQAEINQYIIDLHERLLKLPANLGKHLGGITFQKR